MDPLYLFNLLAQNAWWINILLAITIVYSNRRRPARSTMLWIMMIAIFPIVGFIPYLLLGRDTRRRRLFRAKESLDVDVLHHALIKWDEVTTQVPVEEEGRFQDYLELIRLNVRTGLTSLSGDNDVETFFDGASKFQKLLEDIDAAQEEINFQYYILKSDVLGTTVIQALIRAARRGVVVRVLTDGVGGRALSSGMKRVMRQEGIQVGIFYPSFLRYINLRLNYRNHRKIVTIDERIAYIGGFNVGDEYIGRNYRFGFWRDTHLRIVGSAVADLKVRFLQDWNFVTGGDEMEEREVIAHPSENGDAFCQLVFSGPDSPQANIKLSMLKMIASADDVIYMQTPYFIPDQSFYDALVVALQQGVEVNLMIPNRPDHPVVFPATMSFAGDLIRAGARVYRYEKGFMHSKVMIIDDYVSMVGSCNIDERSFSLNFEASELVYSPRINARLKRAFHEDMQESTLLTREVYNKRSWLLKLKEPICRLFAPLL